MFSALRRVWSRCWFEEITGFKESFGSRDAYADTQRKLLLECFDKERSMMRSVDGKRWSACGTFEVVSLEELRQRVASLSHEQCNSSGEDLLQEEKVIYGDITALHSSMCGGVIQVASQFNMLEMVSPGRCPEDGVTNYAKDMTQGPACALACGAATIYRNYLVEMSDGRIGQSEDNQINGLASLESELASLLGRPSGENKLWVMQNGYCLPSLSVLQEIDAFLASCTEATKDRLRSRLAVGVQWDAEVTFFPVHDPPLLTQVFCSALPLAYSHHSNRPDLWSRFATLVLEATYEATMLVGVCNVGHRGSKNRKVLLTQVGGGAFGNNKAWIDSALTRALQKTDHFRLDPRVVLKGNSS